MKHLLTTVYRITSYCILIFPGSLIFTSHALAAFPYDVYIEPNLTYEKINLRNGDYTAWLGGVTIGVDITDEYAFVGSFGTGVKEGSINSLTVDIDSMTNLFFRMGTTTKRSNRIYILLGQSRSKISYSDSGTSNTDNLKDLAWGIGAEERFKTFKQLYYKLEYLQQYRNDNQSLEGITLGIRFNF
jgi:hypothetical protein